MARFRIDLRGIFGTVLWLLFMASLWLDLGLIYSMLRGCFARFCGLFLLLICGLLVAKFGTDLRGLLRGCLARLCGLFVARFETDLRGLFGTISWLICDIFMGLFKVLFGADFMDCFRDYFGLKLWAVLWCYWLIM